MQMRLSRYGVHAEGVVDQEHEPGGCIGQD